MELTALLIFAISQIGTPGPANMTLMATGAAYGLRPALPFVAGVVLGKQLLIWPIGFGIMGLLSDQPTVMLVLKWASLLYICWLAWRIAGLRLGARDMSARKPGFLAGLAVHPLNPKAWGMIVGAFSFFVAPETPVFAATLQIALVLMGVQLVLHPLWTLGGAWLAQRVAGSRYERLLMFSLAGLTIASVIFVLFL